MKYRKKPVVIDAWRFDGNRVDVVHQAMPRWLKTALALGVIRYQGGDDPYYTIATLEGDMRASAGDWIIRGVDCELYPCKPDIFERTYEAVDNGVRSSAEDTPK